MKILPIHFAPLQGYTEAPYRNAHAICFGGIEAYHTPFARIEHKEIRSKDRRDIAAANNTVPCLIPQVLGNRPEQLRPILDLFRSEGWHEAELNLGCPFPPLTGKRLGCGILPYPDLVKDVLKVIHEYPDLNFSVKMRIGMISAEECLHLADCLNEAPLVRITLHPRLGKQQYKGEVNLEAFAAFADVCRHPLFYNGDLNTREDIHRIANLFPSISGIMLGRGLLANPALALEYQQDTDMDPAEKIRRILQMHRQIQDYYTSHLEGGEAQFLNKIKPYWEYLEPVIGHKVWKQIRKATQRTAYEQAVGSIRP